MLGKIDSSMADFLNRLEKPWFERRGYGTTWKAWDQLAMMAALEKESIVKSRSCRVCINVDYFVCVEDEDLFSIRHQSSYKES